MVNESVVATSKYVTFTQKGIMYRDEKLIAKKREKVEKYLLYSKKRGTLQD
jgi:hypothetical protein